MRIRTPALAALVAAACAAASGHAAVEIDSNTFGGWQARSIGPAVMSGRIAALDAVVDESVTVWVGAAT